MEILAEAEVLLLLLLPRLALLQAAATRLVRYRQTGQYAGDGFEWVDSGSGYLTRTYTGAGSDNNLGQDVIAGGTADKRYKGRRLRRYR